MSITRTIMIHALESETSSLKYLWKLCLKKCGKYARVTESVRVASYKVHWTLPWRSHENRLSPSVDSYLPDPNKILSIFWNDVSSVFGFRRLDSQARPLGPDSNAVFFDDIYNSELPLILFPPLCSYLLYVPESCLCQLSAGQGQWTSDLRPWSDTALPNFVDNSPSPVSCGVCGIRGTIVSLRGDDQCRHKQHL